MNDWTDAIVADRMAVDQEFNSRIAESEFSNQEWDLVMTATEFDIEDPADPANARLVADTSKVPQILPELENIRNHQAAMGGSPGGGGSRGGSGGLFGSLKRAIGLNGTGESGVDDERLREAETLTSEYANALQSRLESTGSWEQICHAYRE